MDGEGSDGVAETVRDRLDWRLYESHFCNSEIRLSVFIGRVTSSPSPSTVRINVVL